MSLPELDNLVRIDKLKVEQGSQFEIDGLLQSANARLEDARRQDLSLESRFDLAYGAAHAIAVAALRWHGYRSDNRYIVFQALQHTLGLRAAEWRLFAEAHSIRNTGEYEGFFAISQQIVTDLVVGTEAIYSATLKLGRIRSEEL